LQVVNAEVSTLLNLLDLVGVGDEIRNRYQPLREPDELSTEERASLSERTLKYIEKLESELQQVSDEKNRIRDRLRKANWARWKS
jgi:Tfp pilus assembly protein PilN